MYDLRSDREARAELWPTRDELHFRMETARDMRAEATRECLLWAGRGIAGLAKGVAHRLARRRRRAETYDALMRRSDRLLADVGIAREDIRLIAKGIDPRAYDPETAGWRRWRRALIDTATARLAVHRERRRIHRELMQYSDRELEEIGVHRRDVPAITRGGQAAAA